MAKKPIKTKPPKKPATPPKPLLNDDSGNGPTPPDDGG